MATYGSEYRVFRFDTLQIGEVGGTGLLGTTLNSIENIKKDSLVFDPGTQTIENHWVEDNDFPDLTAQEPGEAMLEFAVTDMNPDLWALVTGGTTGATYFIAPYTVTDVDPKSFVVRGKANKGFSTKLDITKAKLTVGGQLRFSKSEPGELSIQAYVQRPDVETFPWKLAMITA